MGREGRCATLFLLLLLVMVGRLGEGQADCRVGIWQTPAVLSAPSKLDGGREGGREGRK